MERPSLKDVNGITSLEPIAVARTRPFRGKRLATILDESTSGISDRGSHFVPIRVDGQLKMFVGIIDHVQCHTLFSELVQEQPLGIFMRCMVDLPLSSLCHARHVIRPRWQLHFMS